MTQLSASYLVATFFNNFLPSTIGGDVVRVRDSSKLTGSTTAAAAIVIIDRIIGFGALYVPAFGAFVLGGVRVQHLTGARVVLGGLGVGFAIMAYVFFRPGIARRLMALSRLDRLPWAANHFETVQAAVHVYRQELGSVWKAFAASLALQMVNICYYFAVAHALRIDLSFAACALMVPLCILIQTFFPFSLNGLGVREAMFAQYFNQVGLAHDSAIAFSLLGWGLVVLLSLSGAVVWASRQSSVGGGEAGAGTQ
jgi:glycosyltransferase 2 family protein